MKILVFDNYDSFTYNLVHIIKELGYGQNLDVFRNDKITVEEVGKYDKILLSPGPGIPEEAGIMPQLIKKYAPTKSIMGVCLGHQGIAESFGAELFNMPEVLHGIPTDIVVTDQSEYLFAGLEKSFTAGRYHSWMVKHESVAGELKITAVDAMNQVMAISHKNYDVRGVQFHPESVLTGAGKQMIKNWLENKQ